MGHYLIKKLAQKHFIDITKLIKAVLFAYYYQLLRHEKINVSLNFLARPLYY